MPKITVLSEQSKPGPKSAKAKRLTKMKDNIILNYKKKVKPKHLSNYFADPFIVSRVKSYLEGNKDKVHVDIDEMVDDLMSMHTDYARKKRGPFKAIVAKAFTSVLKNHHGFNDDSEDELDITNENYEDEELLDDDDDDEEDEEEEEEEDEEEENEEVDDEEEEDEENEIFPRKRIFEEITALKSNKKKMSNVKDKLVPHRNGTQELINISSDESEDEANKKANSINKKFVSSNVPMTSGRCTPTPPRSLTALTKNNSQDYSPAVILAKRKPFTSTLSRFIPPVNGSSSNQAHLEFPIKTKTCVKFSDVGGCSKVLKEISQFVLHLRHPEVYQYLGVVPPRGFLLHGPPGSGKTLLARAIAGELKLPLIQVASPELVKGISGSSEERIRVLFDQAVSIAPCILFLDEIDVITPRRDNAQREMERRIVAQLLSSFDELTTTHNGNKVLVIGATNRPDSIDPALRRAGRFDREICLGIPDKNARHEILKILTAKLRLSPSVSLVEVAARTPGYVGADLRALITEASIAAVDRLFGDKNEGVTLEDVNEVDCVNCIAPNEIDIELPSKDEEMKDLSTTKTYNDETNTNKESVDDLGEPIAKIRKIAGEESNNEEIEILKSGNNDLEDKKSKSVPANKTESEKNEGNTITNPEGVTSDSQAKSDDAVIINVEDEDNEIKLLGINKNCEIKISSLLHDTVPLNAKQLKSLVVEECDFDSALKIVQPSSKREGFVTVPDVTWDDIGSLKHVQSELQLMIMAPVRYEAAFSSLGLRSSSGVLLCGPPGCGKTLVAKAVANEAGINFISVKGPELLNMYVGESEKAVRQCFMRARNSQPCVIFFDELDAICPKRSDFGEGGASMRVVNQLLTEMDGVEGRHGVFVMAASNRPDIIDPAVLRPGRLDKILFIGLPSPSDRVDILKALTKSGTKPALDEDVSLEAIAHCELCSNFTGADLSSLVHEAGVKALMEFMENGGGVGSIKVAAKHFQYAFQKIRPSVSEEDQKHYEKLRLKYAALPGESTMEVSE